jgi:hypothetical protein
MHCPRSIKRHMQEKWFMEKHFLLILNKGNMPKYIIKAYYNLKWKVTKRKYKDNTMCDINDDIKEQCMTQFMSFVFLL